MYKEKGNSNSEPYSTEINKNTLYILILSIITCNNYAFLPFFLVRLCHLILFSDLKMLLVFVSDGTLKYCNNGHQDHHVEDPVEHKGLFYLKVPIQGMTHMP
jgi:hypothetical protein